MKYNIIISDSKVSLDLKNYIIDKINLEIDEENPDLVIAIGGDGTIIKVSHKYPSSIIFGIHTGHLGFYANYFVEDVDLLINDINNNTYNVYEYNVLKAEINADNKMIVDYALNEVTIVSPLRTLTLDVNIDDSYLERYRGTGLCISTSSGSTAYNKSLHGSVLDPSITAMQLTEIASINSNAYRTLGSPIVLYKNRKICLTTIREEEKEVFITVDHINYPISKLDSLKIYYDGKIIKMAYHNQDDFLSRIRRTFLSKDSK